MMNITKLNKELHQALGKIGKFERCALLDYPDYLNIGDRLIGLGAILYLTEVQQTEIQYIASVTDFSAEILAKKAGKAPIFLNGGGNLGDLWPTFQRFREQIISQYKDRPIVILPQSIYFANEENLKEAAEVFNGHPDLTLFVRDRYSYEIACQHFSNCQVILAPDMAFQLVELKNSCLKNNHQKSILYHCREDRELNRNNLDLSKEFANLVVEDWVSYKWLLGVRKPWLVQKLLQGYREGWQRGLATPKEYLSRQKWLSSHPYKSKLERIYQPERHHLSLSSIHSGIYQFQQHRLIITNRLHGHILCILLGMPHIFLPNSYHKNEQFYQTWTNSIPFGKLVKEPAKIKTAVQELLNLFPD